MSHKLTSTHLAESDSTKQPTEPNTSPTTNQDPPPPTPLYPAKPGIGMGLPVAALFIALGSLLGIGKNK